MIHTIRIRGFKRFGDLTLKLPGHVVLAGPNNTGKTTVLQAIASWSVAFRRWRELGDFNRTDEYARAPIARQAFPSVPLGNFDMLWTDRLYRPGSRVEVELRHRAGWSVTMEFIADTTEQVFVRPTADAAPDVLRGLELPVVFVPPMTGVGIDEPLYQPAKIEQLLGLGRPGEVLRNLLNDAHLSQPVWKELQASIEKIFGYELRRPDTAAAHILSQYRISDETVAPRPWLDIASAGSGFLQVLMLLAFLHARPGAVLLLDEPDAHLHVILQDAIHYELRTVAARNRCQLIVATHSEVVINAAEPSELIVMMNEPRSVADTGERSRPIAAMRIVSQTEMTQVLGLRGVLYVEDYTDMNLLRTFAARLGHRAENLLKSEVMWKQTVFQTSERSGAPGIRSREHFEALQVARSDVRGVELVDGDARPDIRGKTITGSGLQRLRWRRYEIESYLIHPDAIARFIEHAVDVDEATGKMSAMRAYWEDNFPPAVVRDPLGDHDYLNEIKARTRLLPPLLKAAGLSDLSYTRYHEIAEVMLPEEIHPEVTEKLDAICRAFGLDP